MDRITIDNDVLRALRKEAVLTQQELADAVGVHVGTIARLEQWKRDSTSARTLRKLAKVLGVTPRELRYAPDLEAEEGEG